MHILFECITFFAQIIWICKDDLSISSKYSNRIVNNVSYDHNVTTPKLQKIATFHVPPVRQAAMAVINQTMYKEELQIEAPKVSIDIGVTTESVRNSYKMATETNVLVQPLTNITKSNVSHASNTRVTMSRGLLSLRPWSVTNKTLTRKKLVYLFFLQNDKSKSGNVSSNTQQELNLTPGRRNENDGELKDSSAGNQSFINMTNNNGPNTAPCRIPDVTESVMNGIQNYMQGSKPTSESKNSQQTFTSNKTANDNLLKKPGRHDDEIITESQDVKFPSSMQTRGILLLNFSTKMDGDGNSTSSWKLYDDEYHNATEAILSKTARSLYNRASITDINSLSPNHTSTTQAATLQSTANHNVQDDEVNKSDIDDKDRNKIKQGDLSPKKKSILCLIVMMCCRLTNNSSTNKVACMYRNTPFHPENVCGNLSSPYPGHQDHWNGTLIRNSLICYVHCVLQVNSSRQQTYGHIQEVKNDEDSILHQIEDLCGDHNRTVADTYSEVLKHLEISDDLYDDLLLYKDIAKQKMQGVLNSTMQEFTNHTTANINDNKDHTMLSEALTSGIPELTSENLSTNFNAPLSTKGYENKKPGQSNQSYTTSLLSYLTKTMSTNSPGNSEWVTRKPLMTTNKTNTKRPILHATNRDKEFSRYHVKVSVKYHKM